MGDGRGARFGFVAGAVRMKLATVEQVGCKRAYFPAVEVKRWLPPISRPRM